MGASQLYRNAVAALGTRQADWAEAEARIEATVGPDRRNEDGAAVAQMIRTENHLSVDPLRAVPEPMSELLGELAEATWAHDAVGVRDKYNAVVSGYALRGRPVEGPPGTYYRYLNGPGLLKGIPVALEEAGAEHLAQVLRWHVDAAEREEGGANWQDVLDEVRDPRVWDLLPRGRLLLARRGDPSMFVTFDDPDAPIDRDRASQVHAALGLNWPLRDECFIQVWLPASPAAALHVPTFADARWFRFFQSAKPDARCGRTRPHDGSLPAQPEAVRATGTLGELHSSSDLRILPM